MPEQGITGLRRLRILRMCCQAREQGGLLSYEDLAYRLLNCGVRTIVRDVEHLRGESLVVPTRGQQQDMEPGQTHRVKAVELFLAGHEPREIAQRLYHSLSTISRCVLAHERTTLETVPRRGTFHDMGRSISHKRVICYKRLVEEKSTAQVARETYHDPEEVEYYVQCMRRLKICRDTGMEPDDIALAAGHSKSLVMEYLDLANEFHLPHLKNTNDPHTVQTAHNSQAKRHNRSAR